MSRAPRRRGPLASLAAVAAAAVLVAGACAGPRSSLGTRSTPCYRTLPAAAAAVHGHGSLVGVRRATRANLSAVFPAGAIRPGRQACVVAFRGDYPPGSVEGVVRVEGHRYAVVAVDAARVELLASVVVDRLPIRFHHRFAGRR